MRWLLVLLVLCCSACGEPEKAAYQEQGYVFGTLVEVSIYGAEEPVARAAAASVMGEFQRLHQLLHAWQPSPLSELNAALAQGKSMAVPEELVRLLQDAAALSAQSGGLFNPAIGGLIQRWGFQSDEFKPELPDPAAIAALVKAAPQMSDLHFDGLRVSSANPALRLDLGGYAKGYALDRAAELLRAQGIRNALINIGGNVLALGQHGERAWRVGIRNPREALPVATVELRDGEAIGTSGDYQRYFEVGGQRYCHLIDPRSGYPATGVQAVTILTHGARAGVLSDASSKPLFMNGVAGWRAAAQQMNLPEAMLIDAAGRVHLTAAMQKRLEFADKKMPRTVEP